MAQGAAPHDKYYFTAEKMTVGYDGVPLIENIDIEIAKGEILTLIGPNGAGKSTILKTITKQLSLLGGAVYLNGEDIHKVNQKELAKQIAVMLTERIRPELMTCEDVVGTGRYPYTGSLGLLTEEDEAVVKRTMELVRISELADRDFMAISDGQRQRVMLARAICQEPELMILDEPTSFLDIRYKLEFLNILQEMSRKQGMTVVMSLHELDLAERISDKILCVRGKTIDRFGTPDEVFEPGYIDSLYELTVGSYDASSGRVELPRIEGEPEVFVISGNGTGTSFFRQLQRLSVPFATGILSQNDIDYPVASVLAANVISVPAFTFFGEGELAQARAQIDSCGCVVITLGSEATIPHELNSLLEYAAGIGKQVLSPGEYLAQRAAQA
ncbi:MAG: ABC transporter ATP-binding protein [bacterium]|nr:ABC transporter ATP-binding protein [bacterium]